MLRILHMLSSSVLCNFQKYVINNLSYFLIFLEPFLEAIPQVVITLMFQCHSFFTVNSDVVLEWSNMFPMYFTLNFCVSLLSGSLGISKLLKVGPCRLVHYDGLNIGFVFIVLSNLACILGKGTLLFTILFGSFVEDKHISSFWNVATTCAIVYSVPHFFLVSIFSHYKFYLKEKNNKKR